MLDRRDRSLRVDRHTADGISDFHSLPPLFDRARHQVKMIWPPAVPGPETPFQRSGRWQSTGRPGQRKVFERRKVMRLERGGRRLALFHSMHDNVHGFEVTYEIDTTTGRIVKAEHLTPRLPYMGICSEPQRRIAALVGEQVDAGLRKRIQAHLGGPTGCAQLYDLTTDLLKLLERSTWRLRQPAAHRRRRSVQRCARAT